MSGIITKPEKGDKVLFKVDGQDMWATGKVYRTHKRSDRVIVDHEGEKVNVDNAYLINPSVEDDITSLWHIHEPGILLNLEKRSLKDKPYTFMGPILVAVNPLQSVKNPYIDYSDESSIRKGILKPHPYSVAEMAYKQLGFAIRQRTIQSKKKKDDTTDDVVVNQSIIVGGESGAGKTESSKMVLRHLVGRACGQKSKKSSKLDKRLLMSNPILEAFGNASTLRNPNSSRFGKFLKLHFDLQAEKITGASIETYLLERSRVVTHEFGERGYHVFYQLMAGLSKSKKKSFGVDAKTKFRYLQATRPKQQEDQSGKKGSGLKRVGSVSIMKKKDTEDLGDMEVRSTDSTAFEELNSSLLAVGLMEEEIDTIFSVCFGVLHLGNIMFVDDEQTQGDVAMVSNATKQHLQHASKLFGFQSDKLAKLFIERTVTAGGETMVTFRNSEDASFARHAVSKAIYTRLFSWLIKKINASLCDKMEKEQPFIGVLDIFGFESFLHNDFEQLLINYTNEALQSTFNNQVFIAEAELYMREGLCINNEDIMVKPPNNNECMELLQSSSGLLATIASQAQLPKPSDQKMLMEFHRQFTPKYKKYAALDPRYMNRCFAINHYAGQVRYTIGNFLQKNNDSLPNEVESFVKSSKVSIVKELVNPEDTTKKVGARGSLKKSNIVVKFKAQISKVTATLDATRCLFIRCIKPNPEMVREGNWYNRRYVSSQLKCLSIPQTAEVLKSGFPTRIAYSTLTESYKSLLPAEAIKSWKILAKKDEKSFVSALFWAFDIPRQDYKLGLSKVFFRAGKIDALDKILQTAGDWSSSSSKSKSQKQITSKIKRYFAWRLWRICFIKITCMNAFRSSLSSASVRIQSATKIQTMFRASKAHNEYKAFQSAIILFQYMHRRKHRSIKVKSAKKPKREKSKKDKVAKELDNIKQELDKPSRSKRKTEKLEEKYRRKLSELKHIEGYANSGDDSDSENSENEENKSSDHSKRYKSKKKKKDKKKKSKSPKGDRRRSNGTDDLDEESKSKKKGRKSMKKKKSSQEKLFKKTSKNATEIHLEDEEKEDRSSKSNKKKRSKRRKGKKHEELEKEREFKNRTVEALKNKIKAEKVRNSVRFSKHYSKRTSIRNTKNLRKSKVPVCYSVNSIAGEVTFNVEKLSVKTKRNWKRRFIVLNTHMGTLSYFAKQGSLAGAKGTFRWNESSTVDSIDGVHRNRENCVKISGGKSSKYPKLDNLEIVLAFEDDEDKSEFLDAIKYSIHGEDRDEIERVAEQMSDSELGIDTTTLYDGDNILDNKVVGDVFGLSPADVEQLDDFDEMRRDGEISVTTYMALLLSVASKSKFGRAEEDGYDGEDEYDGEFDGGIPTLCSNRACGKVGNTTNGKTCKSCGGELILDDFF